MRERTRFDFIEEEERPRRRQVAPTGERPQVTREARREARPPGAAFTPSDLLEPITNTTLFPGGGRTEFHYLYDQIANVAAGLSGQGPMAPALADMSDVSITNPQDGQILVYDAPTLTWVNEAPGGASLTTANTWTAVQSFCVDDTNNNAVSRAVTICHTSSNDGAVAGIGSGVNLDVEASLGGPLVRLAQIDAVAAALGSTAGTETGRILLNVASAGVLNNEVLIVPQQFTFPRAPIASATRALVQMGSGPWHFGGSVPAGALNHGDAQGCVLAINEASGYAGVLAYFAIGNVPRFRIEDSGHATVAVNDTTTLGESPALSVYHRLNSGTASVGHGTALDLYAENGAGNDLLHASIWTQTENISAGAEQIGLVFSCRVAGTFGERARFSGANGNFNCLADVASQTGINVGQFINRGAVLHVQRVGTSNPAAAQRTSFILQSPSDSALPAGTEVHDALFRLDSAKEWNAGALTFQRFISIMAPSITFTGASTVTKAATLAISGAPTAGLNATITDSYALWVEDGKSRFTGDANGVVFELPTYTAAAPAGLNNKIKVYIPGLGEKFIGIYDT